MPPHLSFFQFRGTMPLFTSVVTSGSSESATTSALSPEMTARACSPDAP